MLAGPLALIGEFVSDRQPKTPVRRKIMVGYEKWALRRSKAPFSSIPHNRKQSKVRREVGYRSHDGSFAAGWTVLKAKPYGGCAGLDRGRSHR